MTKLLFQCSKIVVIVAMSLILLARFIGRAKESSSDLLAYSDDVYNKRSLILYDVNSRMKAPIFSSAGAIQFSLNVDGRLAYSSRQNSNAGIYLLDTQSPDQKLINITLNPTSIEFPLSWSPDGHYLAFVSNQDEKVLLYIWDGETAVNITPRTPVGSPDIETYYNLTWSNDGRLAFIVFYRSRSIPLEIYLWDGNTTTNLSQNPIGEDSGPVWNTDGHIAFMSNRDGIYNIFGWDGQSFKGGLPDIQPLINDPSGMISDSSVPGWTSDGRLTFTGQTAADTNPQIYVWDGQTATNISQNPTLHNGRPVWSNDGRWAFTTYLPSQQQVYVRDADNNRLLTTAAQFTPAWSPNGNLAFCVPSARGWTISVWDGKEVIEITEGSEIFARWSNSKGISCYSA